MLKKGERYRPDNDRPTSPTSVPCKLTEHTMVGAVGHAESNIVCRDKHGFRRGRSCESQLLGLVDETTAATEKGKLVMDFFKAFDKACHSLLT